MPDWSVLRFHPVAATKVSIAKPSGGVSSICVVVTPSFSVGTASVNICVVPAVTTGGLRLACAEALAQNTSAAATASGGTSHLGIVGFLSVAV